MVLLFAEVNNKVREKDRLLSLLINLCSEDFFLLKVTQNSETILSLQLLKGVQRPACIA